MPRFLFVAVLIIVACTTVPGGVAQTPNSVSEPAVTSAATRSAVPAVTREPAALAIFPEEAAVIASLDRAGIHLSLIGESKFETLLGARQRARVFIEKGGTGGAGADVLFLDRPIAEVRVCGSRTPAGLNHYDIFVGDQRVQYGEGTQEVLYSISGRYFIQAVGKAFSDALMAGLGTERPRC